MASHASSYTWHPKRFEKETASFRCVVNTQGRKLLSWSCKAHTAAACLRVEWAYNSRNVPTLQHTQSERCLWCERMELSKPLECFNLTIWTPPQYIWSWGAECSLSTAHMSTQASVSWHDAISEILLKNASLCLPSSFQCRERVVCLILLHMQIEHCKQPE